MQSALPGRCLTKIILFQTDTLSKFTKILSVRKKQNLKYAEFVLPNYIDDIHGFNMSCYRKFTALSKTQREDNNDMCNQHDQPTRITRSNLTSPATTSRTGIFPKVCLFCNKEHKKVKGKGQKLSNVETVIFEENIRKYANWKEDNIMLAKISQIDFAAKEVKYHGWCRAKYQTEAESIFQSKNSKTPNDTSFTHSEIYYEH